MELPEQKLSELSDKWLKGTLNPDELAMLEAWYNSASKQNVEWTAGDVDENELEGRLFDQISSSISEEKPVRYFFNKALAYKIAAAVIIALGVSFIYQSYIKTQPAEKLAVVNKPEVKQPDDYNKAVLILANGQTVELDAAENGVLAQEGGTSIQKTGDGELLYDETGTSRNDSEVGINTITTPKGGQYHISLPDGSKIWLNALSSLKFPTAFKGAKRVVELTGEAYFEIAKDKTKAFLVKMPNETTIEVLGTHFNIAAYPNERSINATLLEGSIDIQKGNFKKMLVPGQMAEVTDKIQLHQVNAEDAISWKNGLFRFDKDNVSTVMHELERWYGVEVSYNNGIPDNEITGYISRSAKLNEVLHMLELSDVKTKQQGNKIIVYKN